MKWSSHGAFCPLRGPGRACRGRGLGEPDEAVVSRRASSGSRSRAGAAGGEGWARWMKWSSHGAFRPARGLGGCAGGEGRARWMKRSPHGAFRPARSQNRSGRRQTHRAADPDALPRCRPGTAGAAARAPDGAPPRSAAPRSAGSPVEVTPMALGPARPADLSRVGRRGAPDGVGGAGRTLPERRLVRGAEVRFALRSRRRTGRAVETDEPVGWVRVSSGSRSRAGAAGARGGRAG